MKRHPRTEFTIERGRKYHTAEQVADHMRDLHPHLQDEELSLDVILKYPRWRLVEGMDTNKFIPRGHDEQIAEEYTEGIEDAPPIIAVPNADRHNLAVHYPTKDERPSMYAILDGAHRHAAAVMVGKGVNALVPLKKGAAR